MAAALGSGSGATFALIARVTDPSRVGGVTGLVGAAGGLGGFVPPLIMGYVYGRTDSYAIGLWMLSVTAALTLLLTLTVVRHATCPAATTRRGAKQRTAVTCRGSCPASTSAHAAKATQSSRPSDRHGRRAGRSASPR